MGVRFPKHQVTPPTADADTYGEQLGRLMPAGLAWVPGTGLRIVSVLRGLGAELARLHNRALDLLDEYDPRTTDEHLEDWERIAGLEATGTDDERRAALWAAVTAYGGQNAAYFVELALKAGFTIDIESGNSMSMQPFRCGSSGCDETLRGYAWSFAWVIHADAGLSTDEKATLAALIDRHRPIHSPPHYVYDL
tara:strand:- start:5073 stop:5654 length:582 start_codon:yes stop_codon:yes gene_type:complete